MKAAPKTVNVFISSQIYKSMPVMQNYYSVTIKLLNGAWLKYRSVKPGAEMALLGWVGEKVGPVEYGNVYNKKSGQYINRIYPVKYP